MKGKRTAAGFSVVELLAMIAVVVLLAGLMMPTMRGEKKGRAQRIKCVNNLKNLGLAIRIFATENGDRFPAGMMMSMGLR